MNPAYILLRLIRHSLPEGVVRFLLLRSMFIKPGLETEDPQGAARRYIDVLQSAERRLVGSRVLVFGYGGRFDIGVALLEAGATAIALCDPHARPDNGHNAALLGRHPVYSSPGKDGPRPNPDHIQLIEADVRALPPPEPSQRFDLVISNSVYEHVDDAAGITRALARWTRPDGFHIHFVDLRDHYFKYPFEMLKFSEGTWRRFLNPTSNHNRLRLWEFRQIFESHFASVEVAVLARDNAAFERARLRIRPEFLSGDPEDDAATLIRITAQTPMH
jgi:SAM-dependent methyltransferase